MTTPQYATGSTGSNPTTSTVIVTSTPDDEFDRFEALTRRLVRVPKEELDRKRAEEQRR